MLEGLALVAVGAVVLVAAFVLKMRHDKYEFESRTEGGAVQYENYGSAVGAWWMRQGATLLAIMGVVAIAFGLLQYFIIHPTERRSNELQPWDSRSARPDNLSEEPFVAPPPSP